MIDYLPHPNRLGAWKTHSKVPKQGNRKLIKFSIQVQHSIHVQQSNYLYRGVTLTGLSRTMNKRSNPYVDDEAEDTSTEEETSDGEDPDNDIGGAAAPPPKRQRLPAAEPVPRFTLHARQLFLTYPQCDLSKEDAFSQLVDILGEPKEWIIAQEKHLCK